MLMSAPKHITGNIDPIDRKLGQLLRLARKSCGMSQETLGSMNRLTFQQIQKYENGQNRISVSRLMHMAESLGISAIWFIEKLNDNKSVKNSISEINLALLNKHEVQEFLEAYSKISDKNQRQFLRLIIVLLAAHATGGSND